MHLKLALDNPECPTYQLLVVETPLGWLTDYVILKSLVRTKNLTSHATQAEIPQVLHLKTDKLLQKVYPTGIL